MFFNHVKLAQKLGVHFETIKKYSYDDFLSSAKYPEDKEMKILQRSMRKIYNEFVMHVRKERKIENVSKVAQGRIWTGSQAVKNKLADEVGGLLDTINYVAKHEDVGDYMLDLYPKPMDFFSKISNINQIYYKYITDSSFGNIKQLLDLYSLYIKHGLNTYLLSPFLQAE